MLEKLFWFGLGYLTARYFILKHGTETYVQKESNLINKGNSIVNDASEQFFNEPASQYYTDYQTY